MAWFRNYYRCPGNLDFRKEHDPIEWDDEADCECDDKCPECHAELTPLRSDYLGDEDANSISW